MLRWRLQQTAKGLRACDVLNFWIIGKPEMIQSWPSKPPHYLKERFEVAGTTMY
jgi:hypothetical protein